MTNTSIERSGKPATSGRNHALDGLRAIAAVTIVLFHLGLTGLVAIALGGGHQISSFMHGLGSSGVELFFTLSAVVLLKPYLTKQRRMAVWPYLKRRLNRLWPPFLGAWLLAGATVAVVAAYPTWWPSAMPAFDWGTWASQAFIFYAGNSAYNFAWWTLTIEVLFYVLAPLLVLVLAGRSERTMAIVLVASIVLSQGATLIPAGSPLLGLAERFLVFASCFVGGMLLATYKLSTSTRWAICGAGALFIAGNAIDARVDGHVGFGLLYMAIVSSAMQDRSFLNVALSRQLPVWLGERSYSLFLTHYSVIALACWSTSLLIHDKGAAYFVVSRTIAIVGALLVSCALFELVESRFAHGLSTVGEWWPGRRRSAVDAA